MTSAFTTLHRAFEIERDKFMRSGVIARLARGEIRVDHYAQLMRQIYHQARENPQLQALATVRLRGPQREMVAPFYRHAASEVGHDELALADYMACGGQVQTVRIENPHPATSAVVAFAFHQVYNLNPVGYLGYLFFLEFLPTSVGNGLIERLRAVGVPDTAFKFLSDHVTIDQGHNRAMEKYCAALLTRQADLDAALYALRATAMLYTRMVESAVAMADEPLDFGLSPDERAAHAPLAL